MPSVSVQRALGWGSPGAPGSAKQAEFERKHIRTLNLKGVETVRINRKIAPMVKAIGVILQAHGEHLERVRDDWGFANRDIRGYPGVKSYHAWGLAVDWEATEHPMGVRWTNFPITVTNLACKKLSLTWGFNFSGRADAMHMEFRGSRLRAKYLRYKLKRVNKRTRTLARLAGLDVHTFIRRVNNAT